MPADFPYLTNPPSLIKFLEKIKTVGIPGKVTIVYLNSLGFKSTNDRPIIPALKFLEFIDTSGVPKENWKHYRSDAGDAVLASAIRKGYSELFATYADADRKDTEALRNFFSTHTSVGAKTLGLIVRTFKALCESADFQSAPPAPNGDEPVAHTEHKGKSTITATTTTRQTPGGPTLNINIQLQLQATEDAKVYDAFFAAMKKHLFPE